MKIQRKDHMWALNPKERKFWFELTKREVHVIHDEGDYEKRVRVLAFPKNWSRNIIKFWLLEYGYPCETERYPIYSDYDCTGKCHVCYVDYKKNHVTFTRYYDV